VIKKMKTRLDSFVERISECVEWVVTRLSTALRGLWRQHRDRMNNDRDYAPAIGAATTAMAALFTTDPALLAVVAAVVALYVALHHATRPSNWPSPDRPEGGSRGGWEPDLGPARGGRQNTAHSGWDPYQDRWDDLSPRWDGGQP
jgi:hypothetical protein